jgi:16S rRNA A1518/A1519 N6-dimethyltransferase RsmA/KsgA/DIM1 with predicted DNA glycosylase/AP lyase activity
MDFQFKKSFGQNFLKDNNITESIANSVNYKENNLVIEIGPGAGALTKKILPKVNRAILYEIDSRLEDILKNELNTFNNYEVIFDDFLKSCNLFIIPSKVKESAYAEDANILRIKSDNNGFIFSGIPYE